MATSVPGGGRDALKARALELLQSNRMSRKELFEHLASHGSEEDIRRVVANLMDEGEIRVVGPFLLTASQG